jgi:spermidine synthase
MRPLTARYLALTLCAALLLPSAPALAQNNEVVRKFGKLEVDEKSDYSRIRVRTKGNVRTLLFVRDNGEEVIESKIDVKQPHHLLLDYTKWMFVSYAFQPKQERVCIVGLGGGAMIHFLKKHDPDVKVDVVEIDPVVVKIADEKFGVRSEGNVNVITADGIKYLAETKEQYDVVYMDAFLKPSGETDVNGVPLRLKTGDFYKLIQEKLKPGGMVVFNLNPHSGTRDDIAEITRAFSQTYVFGLGDSPGLVAVGTLAKQRLTLAALLKNGKQLDGRFKATFSFEKMAARLIRN